MTDFEHIVNTLAKDLVEQFPEIEAEIERIVATWRTENRTRTQVLNDLGGVYQNTVKGHPVSIASRAVLAKHGIAVTDAYQRLNEVTNAFFRLRPGERAAAQDETLRTIADLDAVLLFEAEQASVTAAVAKMLTLFNDEVLNSALLRSNPELLEGAHLVRDVLVEFSTTVRGE